MVFQRALKSLVLYDSAQKRIQQEEREISDVLWNKSLVRLRREGEGVLHQELTKIQFYNQRKSGDGEMTTSFLILD